MKKFLKNKYLKYILLFIIILIYHLLLKINYGDDVWFKNIDSGEISNYIINRYNNWSSRLIIEVVMIFLLDLPSLVWCILDSLIFVLLAYSISYLFTDNKYKFIACLLVCIYPLSRFSEAGWYATTLNYLWPLALGLFAFIPIKNAINSTKEKRYMYPFYLIATLFACNQEQMCAIMLCFYIIFIIYLYKKRKLNKFIICQFLLMLASIFFILTCPGNDVRSIAETSTWYPAYENFGSITKLILGIISTFSVSILYVKIPLLLLTILLPVMIYKDNKNVISRIISLVPITIIGFIKFCRLFLINVHPIFEKIINNLSLFTNPIDELVIDFKIIFLLFVIIVFYISIIYCLTILLKKENKYLAILILLAGLSSRFIMGFSPTIFASGFRTFTFLEYSIIILIVYILMEYKKYINKNLYIILTILSVVQIVRTMSLSM